MSEVRLETLSTNKVMIKVDVGVKCGSALEMSDWMEYD